MAHPASWRGRGARPLRFGLREPRWNWRLALALTFNFAVLGVLFAAGCQHLQGAA